MGVSSVSVADVLHKIQRAVMQSMKRQLITNFQLKNDKLKDESMASIILYICEFENDEDGDEQKKIINFRTGKCAILYNK